ncbi:MAG: hypothetical protein JSU92_13075 [Deltaproteobacteria bacterium]|nr:MAG: hypothetical protein JSU92_13075 [Deltaproteobacteria bacterium]
MSSGKKIAVFAVASLLIFISRSGESLWAQEEQPATDGVKTITRWPDPVVMKAEVLPKELLGSLISNLRLYAYRDGKFAPILFQIDEMTEEGDWVLPEGKKNNANLGNGILDPQDVLLFMVSDTGDRAEKEKWLEGFAGGIEIEVVDPLTGGKGWCYFLHFPTNPPSLSSQSPYVHYDHENESIQTDYFQSKYIITKDGLHSSYYEYEIMPPSAGGCGKNYVDRLKIRPRYKIRFLPTIRLNEENLSSDVLAYKRGPIRVVRRVEQWAGMFFNVKLMRTFSDVCQYRNTTTVPVTVHIPGSFQKLVLKEAVIRFGTDYGPNALGSMTYNSNNLQGFVVDGKMDDGEEDFNPAPDTWRVLTGSCGTFMTRSLFPDPIEGFEVKMGLIDDQKDKDPPEQSPGNIGYMWQDWDLTSAKGFVGDYRFYLEFSHPPNYQLGDEVPYLNYIDHPLKLIIGENKVDNQPLLSAQIGKGF